MDKKNKDFNDVLSEAKNLGYAETNPSSDLNGEDVGSKLKILSSLCFNSFIDNTIHIEGIKFIDKIDIDNANKLGYKIKLLGFSELINPALVPSIISLSEYAVSSAQSIIWHSTDLKPFLSEPGA